VVLGRALAGRRHEAVIATKVSRAHLSGDEVQQACEGSLRRLQTDYIDLYQIHWPSRTVPLDETMEALRKLRGQGKVRAIGVCNFGLQDLSHLLTVGWAETNQLPYSLLWRAIEYQIRQKCLDVGIGILCYSPLAQGLLTGKFSSLDEVPEGRARPRLFSGERPQTRHGEAGCEREVFTAIEQIRRICDGIGQPMATVALAWLLHQPGVTSVIAGARRPDQIRQTAQAGDLELWPEALAALAEATEGVKQKMGLNPDLWQSESRLR
jgi:aryl-alcohol dehydrogenase-like predicted oxidoreductase